MKLVLIYGPPACGKLTVAKELSRRTGFRLLHNHLPFDYALQIVPFGRQEFWELVGKLRLLTVDAAAKAGISLVSTFCYSFPHDTPHIRRLTGLVKKHNGRIFPVHLTCRPAFLEKRVLNASRKKYKKLHDVRRLKAVLASADFYTPIPGLRSLEIDNSDLPATRCAAVIRKTFRL